jgi:hypothetical protein
MQHPPAGDMLYGWLSHPGYANRLPAEQLLTPLFSLVAP